MSIDLYPVFQLNSNADIPTNQITSELNTLRTIVTRKFYIDLNQQQKLFFLNFLWDTLHRFTQHSTPAVRLASSSVIGNILLNLGPFFFKDLMNSLLEAIKKLNENEGSYVYLTSFVYLSKFLSASTLNQVLLSNSLIFNLFSKVSNEHLPNLVAQLDNFSNKFLVLIVDLFIKLSLQNPNNRHLPKAAAILISKSIDNYSSILSNQNLSLLLISSLFPDRLPKHIDQNVSLSILKRAIEAIKSDSTLPTDYEAACKVVYQLYSGNHIQSELIKKQITDEIVLKSTNPTALLMLPIDESIISTSFYDIDQITSETEIEKSKINPLMNYLSLNYKPEFSDKLILLINKNLTPASDSYSFALKVLGDVSSSLPISSLNELLFKAFSINTSNWIHKLWTLELINKLNFRLLSQSTTDKAFEVIDISSTSKTDKLTQSAKEVTVKVFETCHIEVFKLFIDEYCRKIDVFDQISFELRISFLSYVFKNSQAQSQSQVDWTISFTRLATLLFEAVNLFDSTFSATVMMNFFNIIESIANNLKEEFMIIILFVRKALDIIEPSFNDFVGDEIGLKRPNLFASTVSNSNSSNGISSISSSLSQLLRVDTDLTSNPGIRHSDLLQSAFAAFSMIANINWSIFDLKNDSIHYLCNLATAFLPLFPCCSNVLIASLIELSILARPEIDKFIQKSLRYSKEGEAVFKIARLIEICIERYDDFSLSEFKQFPEYKQSLKIILSLSRDLDYVNVAAAQTVLEFDKVKIPTNLFAKIIKKSQLYLISDENNNNNNNEENNENIIDPSILYGMNDDDIQDKEEFCCQLNSPLESPGFLLYVQTLSPFYYKHVEIPKELLQPALLKSFFNYSTVKVNLQEANFLLEYCLEKTNEQCIRAFLFYLTRNKIQLDLNPYLNHPLLQKKKNMSAVVSYLKINSLPNDYVTSVLKTDDLVGFVLNASTKLSRLLSISLLKIDPKYFMKGFMNTEKFHYAQIYNVCWYAKENIDFPPDDFYQFAVMLLSKYIESRKKKNIVRRLLTIFVYKNLKNNSIVQEACALLSCDIGPPSNIEYVKKLSNAQIIELYYESLVINRVANCRAILETLLIVLTKSSPYGMLLYITLKQPTFDDINQIMTTSFPLFQLPSMQTLPYRYYSELIKNVTTTKKESETIPLQSNTNSNSNPNLLQNNNLNSDQNQNNNLNVNPLDLSFNVLPSSQIFKLLLSNPNDFNKSNFSFSFPRNHAFGIYVFHFINTILSIFHRKLSTMSTLNNELATTVSKLVKDSFTFVSTNYEFKSESAYVSLFLQMYNTYLSIKMDFDPSDLELINNNVGLLFENNLTILPPLAVDVVIKISNHNKDLLYATTIFGCYLKEKESYESYYVSERAAMFTIASNEKYNTKVKQRLLKLEENKNKTKVKQDKDKLDQQQDQSQFIKSSSSFDFKPGSLASDEKIKKTLFKSVASAKIKHVDDPLDPTTFIVFGKSFIATFCAFVLTKSLSKKEISYQNLLGLFTKRHEKAIVTYVDRTIRPFSILFALMGDEKDKPPKNLSSYINSFHDLLLVNQSEKRYNVF